MLPLHRCALIEAGVKSAINDIVMAMEKNALYLQELMKDGSRIV
jgi:hypothetical protein